LSEDDKAKVRLNCKKTRKERASRDTNASGKVVSKDVGKVRAYERIMSFSIGSHGRVFFHPD